MEYLDNAYRTIAAALRDELDTRGVLVSAAV
jgi:hypothetical protein